MSGSPRIKTAMSDQRIHLQMQHISKAFPGVQALKDVSFEVARGEIHALVGENGAGKTTLMNILSGAMPYDSGEIFINGEAVEIRSPASAQMLGISMIHQELSLIPYLTVGQNIYLGREPAAKIPGFIDWNSLYEGSSELLERLKVKVDPRTDVKELSIAQQQMIEVAKALSLNAELIVMDEPTSSLTDRETEVLFDLMRTFKEQGISLIFISHRLEEVFEIADQVTVLRDGQKIDTCPISELNEEKVVEMMVGRELGEMYPKDELERQQVVLEAIDLSEGEELQSASLKLYGGEILGIAGLAGAGRTALAEALFGIRPIVRGEIKVNGKAVAIKSPQEAIHLGIGLVPENRKLQGLFLNMAVRENIVISTLEKISDWIVINFRRADKMASEYVRKLDIRTPNIRQLVRNLSGGNQQKVVIARWLTLNPRVLILDEPTRGIDVGAKAEIHALMNQLAGQGVGVLMISSDLPEVLGISDRILVMREGRIVREFARQKATQDNIMHAAAGGRTNNDQQSAQ